VSGAKNALAMAVTVDSEMEVGLDEFLVDHPELAVGQVLLRVAAVKALVTEIELKAHHVLSLLGVAELQHHVFWT